MTQASTDLFNLTAERNTQKPKEASDASSAEIITGATLTAISLQKSKYKAIMLRMRESVRLHNHELYLKLNSDFETS
jgi:hypothetical protein